jgi:ribosomal protein L6P/L9E
MCNISFIDNSSIISYKNFLIVKSYYAHVVFDISRFKDDEAFIMFKADSLCFVKGKRLVDKGFKTRFKSIMAGINYFYFKKLNLVGIGFRAWVLHDENKQKKLILKFGFSKHIVLVIPKEVIVFCLRPASIIVKGPNKEITNFVSSRIRFLKRVNVYKGKGILYENEVVSLKLGKQK